MIVLDGVAYDFVRMERGQPISRGGSKSMIFKDAPIVGTWKCSHVQARDRLLLLHSLKSVIIESNKIFVCTRSKIETLSPG